MRKFILLLAAFGLVAAGCGGSGESCDAIVDDAIDLFQDIIDQTESLTMDDLLSDEEPAFLADLDEKGEELQDRANDAGCSDEELSNLLTDKAGNLKADGEIGQLFVDMLQSGEIFE